jgi:Na+/melibiose symporter-like transporter
MGLLFATYLMKFATDVLLIAPAIMGSLIAASRLWDAVSDPLAGYLSDRTKSRFGRRRIWLYCSAVPMGLGLIMMWSPPTLLEGMQLVIWMALALWVYETASTAFFVPYGALGAELTPNYHERTRFFGYVHMIGAIGSLGGLFFVYLLGDAEDKRAMAFTLSMIAGISVTTLVLISTYYLPERADFQGKAMSNPFRSLMDIIRNPHALLLLFVIGIETFGAASIGLLVPYMVDYVIPEENIPFSKAIYFPALLATYTVPQFLFAPLWIKLAGTVGKKRLWGLSLWATAGIFVAYYFSLEYPILIWILSFLLGLVSGVGSVIYPSIQADVIDYDEYLTGERKEGTYLAALNLVRKSAGSVTAFVTGIVLQLVGFEPNVEQSTATQEALRSLFALLPAACYVFGAVAFMRFSLNEGEHDKVRLTIEARRNVPTESPDR